MHTNQLKIIGCGGHCKVVLDALSLTSHELELSLCDSNPSLIGREINGIMIDSTFEFLNEFKGYFHVAIGSNKIREKISTLMHKEALLFTVIHPAAVISKSSLIKEGNFIAARAVLGPESIIGKGCIINHGAVVDHEVKIGDYCHIAPNSTLGGNVTVGKNVLIGSGAVVLPGISIGDNAIIGAGAVVVNHVLSNTLVKGVPAVALSKE